MDSSEEELDGHSLSQLEADNLELHVELLLHLSLQDKLFSGMNFPWIFLLEMDLPKPIDDGLDLMKKRKGKKKKKVSGLKLTKSNESDIILPRLRYFFFMISVSGIWNINNDMNKFIHSSACSFHYWLVLCVDRNSNLLAVGFMQLWEPSLELYLHQPLADLCVCWGN